MMKQLRDSFRLLKYSFAFKINVVCASVFLFLGLVLECANLYEGQSFGVGCVYVELAGLFPAQIWFVLPASRVMAASPWHKKAHTFIPGMLVAICGLACFTLLVITKLIFMLARGINPAFISGLILLQAVSFCFLAIYFGVAYKHYVAATLLFGLTFLPFLMLLMRDMSGNLPQALYLLLNNVPLSILLGYVIFAVGVAIGFLLLQLLSKKEISTWALGPRLRNQI